MSARSPARKPDLKSRMRETAMAAILDAVEEVANERGLDGASIAAIAERAGVAVGTLYNYFPDRDGMFTALFHARRDEIAPRIAKAANEAAYLPFEQRLRAFMRGVGEAFHDQRAFLRLAIAMDAARLPIVRETSLLDQIERHVRDIMRDATSQGVIRGERAEAFTQVLLGSMRALKRWQLEREEAYDADFVVDAFLYGVKGQATRTR